MEEPISSEIVIAIASIWKDGIVARLLDKEGNDFYMMDSAP